MTTAELLAAFEACCLPKEAWTHTAHVTAGAVYAWRHGRAAALDKLRALIPAYNVSVGGENTDTAGYHDTITAYYAAAAAHAGHGAASEAEAVERVLASPHMTREAPLQYWSRALLFSAAARRGFIAPDLATPPFDLAG
jgi:hypothetical protein